MAVQGTVSIEHNAVIVVQASLGASAPAKTGDAVYKGDVVQTGADGKISMVFTDGTAFNLERNARIEVNEFVYDPNGSANAAKFSVLQGALTFVAGQAAKTGSMTLDTRYATMGIRGTTPHVEFLNDGGIKFSTLVEDDRAAAAPPGGAQPSTQRQRQGRAVISPGQDAAYDRFMRLRPKICQNC